jgi:hypothetical protein
MNQYYEYDGKKVYVEVTLILRVIRSVEALHENF